MKKLNIVKKTLSFVTCSALSVGIIAAYPMISGSSNTKASAKTVAELQEERKANEAKIADLQTQIDSLEGNKNAEQQYQNTLKDQIEIIKNNIELLTKELASIEADIETTQNNIDALDKSIVNQQEAIDKKVEVFKERLCAMYVTGNDNLATVVVGTSSFYDMLSRVEMVNRIASYDEELINDILNEINQMEQDKQDLESERLTLVMKQDDQKKRKEEKDAEMEVYYEKTRQSQAEIDRITLEQQTLESDKADLAAMNAEFDAMIEAEIQRQAEEAQRAYEARVAAEQEAARQAQAAAAQQAAQNGESYTPTYSEPAYIPAPSASGFSWPAPGFCYISSGYGYRWGTTHRGIDVGDAGIHGGAACAAKDGTVISVCNSCTHDYAKNSSCGCGGGYGNYVVISHDGTYSTLYGHLASACVSVGQYVSQGQVIGYIGSTGWSTGAHLHFEVRVNGVAQDPMGYVSP
ncbi:murein hydrolase activator EnvC [Ruminococcus sp.]|uniref:murein hydrolase activator EnvC family protein n=1 Tax=Ruminococcus sp. TaxID=41978 RepID=UPI0025FE242D|nr:M23 family metallopeptidase [Ruminococcus sp.]